MRNIGSSSIQNLYGNISITADVVNVPALTIVTPTAAGTSFGLTMSAGTNSSDAAVTIRNAASSALFMSILGNGSGSLGINATNNISWNSSGAFDVGPPVAGSALTVNGIANADAVAINGSTTTGQSYGLSILAGTNTADAPLYMANAANSQVFVQMNGVGSILLGAATGGQQGNGTINATGLFVNGVSVGSGTVQKAVATANTTTTSNNTTYINPTGLSVALLANKYYQVTVVAGANDSTSSGGGWQSAVNYSGTAGTIPGGTVTGGGPSTFTGGTIPVNSALTYANTFIQMAAGAGLVAGETTVHQFIAFGGSVGGNLVYGFRQVSSNASTLTVFAGASISAVQLN